jgi:hypothetical protein
MHSAKLNGHDLYAFLQTCASDYRHIHPAASPTCCRITGSLWSGPPDPHVGGVKVASPRAYDERLRGVAARDTALIRVVAI